MSPEVSMTKAIRHAEKRMGSSCLFADRIAQLSIQHYHNTIPLWYREQQKQVCIATIIAHENRGVVLKELEFGTSAGGEQSRYIIDNGVFDHDDDLQVLALGVGTKFLSESVLRLGTTAGETYGKRVRDCHAEILARRAFRRYLSIEILRLDGQSEEQQPHPDTGPLAKRPKTAKSILEMFGSGKYRLRAGITLHLYSSSAPCGNAVLKKFATMKKVAFRADLGRDDWPRDEHTSMPGHSLPAGEFALLLKKDNTGDTQQSAGLSASPRFVLTKREMAWPCYTSSSWCPPGTTPVWTVNCGNTHTCSDKICRWNILGLQGSLLSSFLDFPLYLSSITIGRKFSEIICRRALCCRAARKNDQYGHNPESNIFFLHHPSLMGTSVCLDEEGVIDMSDGRSVGQDVRFHMPLAWAWWQSADPDNLNCLNGYTGWSHTFSATDSQTAMKDQAITAHVSTFALAELYILIITKKSGLDNSATAYSSALPPSTLAELRKLKRSVAASYESAKHHLLSEHHVFRHWRRREAGLEDETAETDILRPSIVYLIIRKADFDREPCRVFENTREM